MALRGMVDCVPLVGMSYGADICANGCKQLFHLGVCSKVHPLAISGFGNDYAYGLIAPLAVKTPGFYKQQCLSRDCTIHMWLCSCVCSPLLRLCVTAYLGCPQCL